METLQLLLDEISDEQKQILIKAFEDMLEINTNKWADSKIRYWLSEIDDGK